MITSKFSGSQKFPAAFAISMALFFGGAVIPSLALGLDFGSFFSNKAEAEPQVQVQKILLAVDGLSLRAFQEAKRRGLFKSFGNVGAHIAPFPSMTDLSWSEITHTAEIFGNTGRIKSVEAVYLDESTKTLSGDPRDYYRRLAAPKLYMGAFDFYFNPYIEGLMYFPTVEIPKLEIRTVIDDLISAKPKSVLTAYIGGIDSTSHTQKDRLFPVLEVLDKEVSRLIEAYKVKNKNVEVILISDHGNVGNFNEGATEQQLRPVRLDPTFAKIGLTPSQNLATDSSVVTPLMALGTWAPVYLKNRAHIQNIVAEFSKEIWFDLAVWISNSNANFVVSEVQSSEGKARIIFNRQKKLVAYIPLTGNPLDIEAKYQSPGGKPLNWLDAQRSLDASFKTSRPDSIWRIATSSLQQNFDFPDLILTLKDGYYVKGPLGDFANMYRTHGSLTSNSSLGIIASNKSEVPGGLRSADILRVLGIEPRLLFGKTEIYANQSHLEALNRAVALKGIETENRNYSQRRIFQLISKIVEDSRPYFVVTEMKSLLEALKFDPNKSVEDQKILPVGFDITKFDSHSFLTSEDVGSIADAILQHNDLDQAMADSRITSIRSKIEALVGNRQSQSGLPVIDPSTILMQQKNKILAAKRGVMKLYQVPYLLQRSFVVQEKPILSETRNLLFAKNFFKLSTDIGSDILKKRWAANTVVETLFKEVFSEADLEDRIKPAPLNKIYNSKIKDLTFVYVPGIYNSIFDQEIFSLGLLSLEEESGVRVLKAPVQSVCSSDYNANILLNFLKQDTRDRAARGLPVQRYVILGYSKGGVDSLTAFAKDPEFTSRYVVGLVTIASPIMGSPIINKSDLPLSLVNALSENKAPEICATKEPASKSISPNAMARFWRKNEKSLIGLTRYFSVSFVSTPEKSHIFMKATKLIGQFDEDNDGVVTLSGSKLPKSLGAVDFGTIEADHLAGILSSEFNQKAFMRAIATTLAELKIEKLDSNFRWNVNQMLSQISLYKDRVYYKVSYPNQGTEATLYSVKAQNILSGGTQASFGETFQINRILFPPIKDPADDYEPKIALPSSQLNYDPYAILDVSKLPDVLSVARVSESNKANFPKGIMIEYNHKNMVQFRMDHQFNYESRTPVGMDDNLESGYATADFAGSSNWALMRSKENSIRLTTMAYRFKPAEFKNFGLLLAVIKGVNGADPVKGHGGIDDSAFQVWFTLRQRAASTDPSLLSPKNDSVFLFGYYWGDPVKSETRKPGDIFENHYSNKNVVVATLPEAKQLLLNDQSMLGKPITYERSLYQDLKRAFPNRNVDDMDVLAITIQHDSNDAKDSSEAYFKWMRFTP